MQTLTQPLHLPANEYRFLFTNLGPSLGLWRAAEIAALREIQYQTPILDLGAGDGLVMARVLPRVEFALDPDRAALEKAAALGLYQHFLPQAMEDADLPAGCLGSIVSNSVLEHVEHIDAALASAARLLRAGGQLVFTVPTESFSRWLALPGARYAARRNRHFEHRNLWPVEAWARRLEQAGLEIECARPYMRSSWVRVWDALELLQMVHVRARAGRVRVAGRIWKSLSPQSIERLSRWASRLDLAAPPPGGGRLIVARKVGG